MHISSVRRLIASAVAVGVVACVALAPPAVAAQPRIGHYSHTYDNPETPFPTDAAIDFDVVTKNGKLKVQQFMWQTYSCSILTVNKTLAVSGEGKFKFLGKASTPGTAQVNIKVKGKFTSKTKAKVRLKSVDPEYDCGTYRATVKLER